MKRFTIILLLFLSLMCSAKTRVHTEASWGYSPQVFVAKAFAYIPNGVGYRVEEYDNNFSYINNAFLKISSGIEVLDKVSIGIKTGIQRIDEKYNVIPLELELKYFFRSTEKNGIYLLLEGGTALHEWNFQDDILLGAAGLGYREQLYKSLNINFFIQLQGLSCHPLPIDKYEGVIPRERVVFSLIAYTGLVFGVGIGF